MSEVDMYSQIANKQELTYDWLKDEIHCLYEENKKLKEELSKCTRKHWQSKCAEHCINEKLLQSRINKAIKYIEQRFSFDNETNEYYLTHTFDRSNVCELYLILRGKDK